MYFTTIRPQAEDIDRLADLYRDCRRASDMPIVPDYFKSLPDSVFSSTWKALFSSGLYRAKLAVVENIWAGFYMTGPIDIDDYHANFKLSDLPDNCGELHQIYLLPEYHGNSIGKKLYAEAKEDLKSLGYADFIACTYLENEKAKSFYQTLGAKHLKDDVLGKPWHKTVSFFIDKT